MYPNIQLFVVAPPASGKGVVSWCRNFVEPLHERVRRHYNHEMEKEVRPDNDAGPGVPNAYRLELRARPTQSLFYQSDVDLSKAEGKIHDAG